MERWAEHYFNRPASPDVPDTEGFAETSAYLCEVGSADDLSEEELAEIVLRRWAELHERYAEWTTRYSAAQLSQGLWAMFGPYPGMWGDLLIAEELPFEHRERALRSLIVPYRVYVKGWSPDEAMPHGWWMLWDHVLQTGMSDETKEVALKCFKEILAIEDARCQAYALHGLNHLSHPNRPAVVQEWMDAHRDEDWNWEWVEACRDGRAM